VAYEAYHQEAKKLKLKKKLKLIEHKTLKLQYQKLRLNTLHPEKLKLGKFMLEKLKLKKFELHRTQAEEAH
jgi:hypothetical protein